MFFPTLTLRTSNSVVYSKNPIEFIKTSQRLALVRNNEAPESDRVSWYHSKKKQEPAISSKTKEKKQNKT